MKLTYTDTQGKHWVLSDVRTSALPNFIEGTRDDGVRILVAATGDHHLVAEPDSPPNPS